MNFKNSIPLLALSIFTLSTGPVSDVATRIDGASLVVVQNFTESFNRIKEHNLVQLAAMERVLKYKPQYQAVVDAAWNVSAVNDRYVKRLLSLVSESAVSLPSEEQLNLLQLEEEYLSVIHALWEEATPIRGTVFADKDRRAEYLQELSDALPLEKFDQAYLTPRFEQGGQAGFPLLLHRLVASESLILKHLSDQMGRLAYYEDSPLLIRATRPVVHVGESFEASIALGMERYYQDFECTIDGQPQAVMAGRANYKTTTNRLGNQAYTTVVRIKEPLTAETISYQETSHYFVLPSSSK